MTHGKTSRHWLLKYKVYHLPFWCLYHYLWWVVAVGNPIQAAHSIVFSPYIVKFSFYVIAQALAVYFNLYFLIPKYMEKGRFAIYITYLFITVLSTSLLIVTGYYLSAFLSGRTLESLYGPGSDCFSHFFGSALPSTLASMTLAMSIKLTKNWVETRQHQQALEKEKLETELNFLKYQFNPHFLFNTINSIFFLIHKNPDKASASLAKFSELLRYQLYECNDRQIPLSKEIAYLENSIELQKLRQDTRVEVHLDSQGQDTEQLGIAPFVLMTFVENAFKHVSKHTDRPNWIKIKLGLSRERLDFSVSNSVSSHLFADVVHYGGIGLQNVKRRLELIYPGQYVLDIKNEGHEFSVMLHLVLTRYDGLSQTMQKTG